MRLVKPFTLKVQDAKKQRVILMGVIGVIGSSIEHCLVKIGTAPGATKWRTVVERRRS